MTYVLNRLLSVILTLFLITLVTFAVTNILPGDVAMMIMGTQSNPEALEGLRQSLGLNDPLLVQYGNWIGGLLTGDWGTSLIFKKPIAELLAQKAVASAIIVVMSMTIALTLAVPLGVWAAVHRDKWQDTVSSSTLADGRVLARLLLGDRDDPRLRPLAGLVPVLRDSRAVRGFPGRPPTTPSSPPSPWASA